MTEGQAVEEPKRRRLLGFYVAAFVVLALFSGGWLAWPRVMAWHQERTVTQLFINCLDRRVDIEVKDVPGDEALMHFYALLDVGIWTDALDFPDASGTKVTLQYENVPIAVALSDWCSQVGADWTIADISCGKDEEPTLKLCLAKPERIRELERGSPAAAQMVSRYRRSLREWADRAR